MIPSSVVKGFLKRKLDDARLWKKLTNKHLQKRMKALPVRPPVWSRLHRRQKVCVLLGIKFRYFTFHLGKGGGKTFLSIALVRYWLKLFKADGTSHTGKTLVLVPNKVNCREWVRQIKKHSKGSTYLILRGSSVAKWEALRATDAEFIITSYGGLARMACERVEPKPKKGKRSRKKKPYLAPVPKLVNELADTFDGVVLDEVTEIGKRMTLAWRICRKIRQKAKYAYALTGTPFGKVDPTPLWAQFFVIDLGASLGGTLGLFREAFFKKVTNYFTGFPEYKFNNKKKDQLRSAIAHRSISYKTPAKEMPALNEDVVRVHPTSDALNIYEEAKKALIRAHGSFKEQKNVYLRMRQISSGFVGYVDDESGTKAQYEFPKNPKLEALVTHVKELGPGTKAIIFHDFIHSGRMIERELKKLKIKYVAINGHVKDPEAALDIFNDDPKTDILVMDGAGAFGLNLQIASYGFFYERPRRYIIFDQMRGRIYRPYSLHKKAFLYYFETIGTKDEDIRKAHEAGQDFLDYLFNEKAKATFKKADATSASSKRKTKRRKADGKKADGSSARNKTDPDKKPKRRMGSYVSASAEKAPWED